MDCADDLPTLVRSLNFSPGLMPTKTLQGTPMRHRVQTVAHSIFAERQKASTFTNGGRAGVVEGGLVQQLEAAIESIILVHVALSPCSALPSGGPHRAAPSEIHMRPDAGHNPSKLKVPNQTGRKIFPSLRRSRWRPCRIRGGGGAAHAERG